MIVMFFDYIFVHYVLQYYIQLCSSKYICCFMQQRFNLQRKRNKVELLQEGFFFLIHLFARDCLVMKKLEIEKTKPTFIISFLKVVIQVVLVSSISNFFTNTTSLANKWMNLSSSNSALVEMSLLGTEGSVAVNSRYIQYYYIVCTSRPYYSKRRRSSVVSSSDLFQALWTDFA